MLEIFLLIIIALIIVRIIYLIRIKHKSAISIKKARCLIVIGSGGHTQEMLKIIKNLNPALYEPRLYVMADVDIYSEEKINKLESSFQKICTSKYEVIKIPRSRAVKQSYFTSIFTTIYSIMKSIPIVFKYKPDLILCNGPGTCVPICIIGVFLKFLYFSNLKIIFIESICRVKTLSLSGKILLHLVDVLIVQWADLQLKYPKSVFLGRLI